jgi:acyl-coenzyme A thioesterase PaaI-like protein
VSSARPGADGGPARTGLESVRRTITEPHPSPAVHTFDIRTVTADPGDCRTTMACDPAFTDAAGMMPMGAVAMLADTGLTRTVLSWMPAGRVVLTSRVQVSMVGAVPAGTPLLAHGRSVTWDLDGGFSVGTISDPDGTPIAQVSARCVAIPGRWGVPFITPGEDAAQPRAEAHPDGGFLGLRWLPDPGPGADVEARLTDIDPLSNMYGALHGGCGAAILESVLARAAGNREVRPQDLEVHYLRPAPASGVSLSCRGRVLDSTRRYTLCAGELVDDTGRVFTRATARYGELG